MDHTTPTLPVEHRFLIFYTYLIIVFFLTDHLKRDYGREIMYVCKILILNTYLHTLKSSYHIGLVS